MITNQILDSIDNIDSVILESEIDVCHSLLNSYNKITMIVESYHGDLLEDFEIIQEGFGDDVKNDMKKTGANQNKFFKILTALPRLILAVIRALKKKFSKSMDKAGETASSFAQNLKNAPAEVKETVQKVFSKDEGERHTGLKVITAVAGAAAAGGAVLLCVKKFKKTADNIQEKEIQPSEITSMEQLNQIIDEKIKELNESNVSADIDADLNLIKKRHFTNSDRGHMIAEMKKGRDNLKSTVQQNIINLAEVCCPKLAPDNAEEELEKIKSKVNEALNNIIDKINDEALDKIWNDFNAETGYNDNRPYGGSADEDVWRQEKELPNEEKHQIESIGERLWDELSKLNVYMRINCDVDGNIFIRSDVLHTIDQIKKYMKNLEELLAIDTKTTDLTKLNLSKYRVDKNEHSKWLKSPKSNISLEKAAVQTKKAYDEFVSNDTLAKAEKLVSESTDYRSFSSDGNGFEVYKRPGGKELLNIIRDNTIQLRVECDTINKEMTDFDAIMRAFEYINKYYIQKRPEAY